MLKPAARLWRRARFYGYVSNVNVTVRVVIGRTPAGDRAGGRIEERHVGEERGKTFTVIVVLTGMFTSSCAVTLIWPTKKTTVEYTVDPLTVFGWNPGVAS